MDRNAVTATVLIALIMVVWMWWLTPEVPIAPEGAAADSVQLAEPALPLEPEQPPAAPSLTDVAPVADSAFAAAQTGEARLIKVETDLYRALFSTQGGTLVDFELKRYTKYDQATPVHLTDTTGEGALGLFFQTPSSHNIDTRALFFEPDLATDTLGVGEGGAALTFTARIGEGGLIRQTYTFEPGTYEVGLRIEQEGAEQFVTGEGYELVWYGDVPFSEDNPEDEAMRSGAYARSGGEIVKVTLDGEVEEDANPRGQVEWVAVKNKYFTAVMIPDGETRGAELYGAKTGEPAAPGYEETFVARLIMPPAAVEGDQFRLYLGPIQLARFDDYDLGLYDMVDYGYDMFEWMTRPLARFVFIPVFTFLGSFLPNYGLVIIVFAILLKLVLSPLTMSSYKSMARMRELQPKMEAIKEKYADDPQKQQEAMIKMYRETGVNPVGGCLPMLLQWPVLIALWQFLPQSIQIRQQGFLWAPDLSAPDVILELPFTIPFYGDFVAGFTLLMGLSMILQMRLQSMPSSNAQAKVMMYVMPFMLFFFFNKFASGLSLYYLCYNIFSAVQQKLINRSLEANADDPKGAVNGKGQKADARRTKKKAPPRKKTIQRRKQRT